MIFNIVGHHFPDRRVFFQNLLQLIGPSPSRFADGINRLLMGGGMPPAEVDRLQAFIDDLGGPSPEAFRQAIGVAAASPGFQYY